MRRGNLPVEGARAIGVLFGRKQLAIGNHGERFLDSRIYFRGKEIIRMSEACEPIVIVLRLTLRPELAGTPGIFRRWFYPREATTAVKASPFGWRLVGAIVND